MVNHSIKAAVFVALYGIIGLTNSVYAGSERCQKSLQMIDTLRESVANSETLVAAEKKQGRRAPRTPWQFIAREFIRKSATRLELTQMISEAYPEIRWLKAKTAVSPETANFKISEESPSMMVYHESQPEFDRTMVSILNLRQIIRNEYEDYIADQPAPVKLSKSSFKKMRSLFMKILTGSARGGMKDIDYDKLDALLTYMSIHDLGKSRFFVDIVDKVMLFIGDHDQILVKGISENPVVAPSYERLPTNMKQLILNGLKSEFNFGQFAQGENLPGSLLGLSKLDHDSFEFYLAHFILDVGGVQGHAFPKGAKVMIEPVYKGFSLGEEFIPSMFEGASPVDVYNRFVTEIGKKINIDNSSPENFAKIRLALLARASNAESASKVISAFDGLPKTIQKLLIKELNKSGTDDNWGTLLYYAPATIANAVSALQKMRAADSNLTIDPFEEGVRLSLHVFARLFIQSRAELIGKTGAGIFTVDVAKLAERAATDPYSLLNAKFSLARKGDFADVRIEDPKSIDLTKVKLMEQLKDIPGHNVVLIGIGGGSDVIQASVFGRLLQSAGKEIKGVISVRTDKTGSQDSSGKQNVSRTITNPGPLLAPDIHTVLPESSGSGRFVENLPASYFPSFLAIDKLDSQLSANIKAALETLGDVDTIIAVDTGGDSLYRVHHEEGSIIKATPDQDLRVLNDLNNLHIEGLNKLSAVIAVGVDSPDYATDILHDADAKYYDPTKGDSNLIVSTYKEMDFTGENKERYGKTPFAWQAALRGDRGQVYIPLPENLILSETNPWNSYANVTDTSRGIFLMTIDGHVHAISKAVAPTDAIQKPQ